MRDKLWWFLRSKYPLGMGLPRWLMFVGALLYPIEFFRRWRYTPRGYDWLTDTWLIAGVYYSGVALRRLSQANGEIFRVTRTHNVLNFERLTQEGDLPCSHK